MSTGTEILVIDEWLTTTLLNDSTLQALLGAGGNFFIDTIPDKVTYPYAFAQMMAAGATTTTDGTVVLITADFQIKGVDRSPGYAALKPIAQRIHTLIERKENQVLSDGLVLKCVFVRSIHYPEITETVHYRHLGGVYRFWVEGA